MKASKITTASIVAVTLVNLPAGRWPLDEGVQPFSLLHTKLDHILLYGDLFGGHESAPLLRHGAIDSNTLPTVNDTRH
jgi:hypothetical protein